MTSLKILYVGRDLPKSFISGSKASGSLYKDLEFVSLLMSRSIVTKDKT